MIFFVKKIEIFRHRYWYRTGSKGYLHQKIQKILFTPGNYHLHTTELLSDKGFHRNWFRCLKNLRISDYLRCPPEVRKGVRFPRSIRQAVADTLVFGHSYLILQKILAKRTLNSISNTSCQILTLQMEKLVNSINLNHTSVGGGAIMPILHFFMENHSTLRVFWDITALMEAAKKVLFFSGTVLSA